MLFSSVPINESISEVTITIPLQEYENLKAEVLNLKDQLSEFRRLVFGSKSERFIPSETGQCTLFDQEEIETRVASIEQVSYERSKQPKEKQKPVRALLPAHLPREEEIIEPSDLEEGMNKIGEEVTEILEHIPGKLYVRRIVRPKYVKAKENGVKIAALPGLPIPKGNAGPGLLAHIMVSKWVDHLPYYRQIQIFKREGITLSNSTFNNWFNATANLIEPLYECLVDQIKKQDYLQADESPIKVQDHHKEKGTHMGYHWVYHAPKLKLAVFDYRPSRSQQGPRDFLDTFQGYLQTDGYAAYHEQGKKEGIILLACMAHARRYFEKALDNDKIRAEYALGIIKSLYQIERDAKEDETIDLQQLRVEYAIPILHQWKQWLDDQADQVLPKSSIGKAIHYTLSLWNKLIVYTHDEHLLIDNNPIENAIRPLAIGRKNYLFAGSHDAAKKAAMFYSFFACCKLHQVNPYLWFRSVLEQIQDHSVNKLHLLLPQQYKNKE